MDDLDTSFPEAIRKAREARGWTQDDLAAQLGVSQQSVQKWEAGTSLPRPARREKLMKALGLDEHSQIMLQAVRDRYAVTEATVRVARTPQTWHNVRENAFMAAIDDALGQDLSLFLQPPEASSLRSRLFRTDYSSPRLAAEFLHFETLRRPVGSIVVLRRLWNLSTARQIDLQLSEKERQYILVVVTPASDKVPAYELLSRWSFEAELHHIDLHVVENAESAAQLISSYEKGEPPIRASMFYEEGEPPAL